MTTKATSISCILVVFLMTIFSCKNEVQKTDATRYRFFVGTYTRKEGHVDGKGKGIYEISVDVNNKKMEIMGVIEDLVNPSFLCQTDSSNLLAVNEISPNPQNYPGRISRIELNKDGSYRKAQEAGTFGNAPCHISYSAKSGIYAATNYLGGQLAFGSITPEGELGDDLSQITFTGKSSHARQEASHLHQALFTEDGSKLLVSDLGSDKIYVLEVDLKNKKINNTPLFELQLSPGSGPRHMTWGKQKDQLFIAEELSNRLDFTLFDNLTGKIELKSSVSILKNASAPNNTAADIHISPDGSHVLVSSRGENNLVVVPFSNGNFGIPQFIATQGSTPRNFNITRDGKFVLVANQDSDNVSVFEYQGAGRLDYVFSFKLPSPVCIVERF
jgi:6-phosphogluconolactonase